MQRAEMYAFPIDRCAALVRRAAAELSCLNGEAANRWWRDLARELYADLRAQGRKDEAARGEIGRFLAEIQAELCRAAGALPCASVPA